MSICRQLFPAISRQLRNALTEKAEAASISVFTKNLEQLLLTPPVRYHMLCIVRFLTVPRGKRILGIDPGYRTGCKLAALDEVCSL